MLKDSKNKTVIHSAKATTNLFFAHGSDRIPDVITQHDTFPEKDGSEKVEKSSGDTGIQSQQFVLTLVT